MYFIEDYHMGKVNEDYVYSLICKYWNDRHIEKSKDSYCNFDFYDCKYKYELKSRRVNHDKFDTTLIPAMKCHKRTYLLFLFLDGLYYIRFRKEKFDKFHKQFFVKNRPDKEDVKKLYYYIPIEELKKIEVEDKIIIKDHVIKFN
jgi:hypothetical protein